MSWALTRRQATMNAQNTTINDLKIITINLFSVNSPRDFYLVKEGLKKKKKKIKTKLNLKTNSI